MRAAWGEHCQQQQGTQGQQPPAPVASAGRTWHLSLWDRLQEGHGGWARVCAGCRPVPRGPPSTVCLWELLQNPGQPFRLFFPSGERLCQGVSRQEGKGCHLLQLCPENSTPSQRHRQPPWVGQTGRAGGLLALTPLLRARLRRVRLTQRPASGTRGQDVELVPTGPGGLGRDRPRRPGVPVGNQGQAACHWG